MPHFISTPDEETVVQVSGMGPTSATFVNPEHAQKKKSETWGGGLSPISNKGREEAVSLKMTGFSLPTW